MHLNEIRPEWVIALLTLFYVALTGIYVCISRRAFRVLREQARYMGEGISLARDQLVLAREALQVTERAYVNLKDITVQNFEPSRSPLVILKIDNSGRTPAYLTNTSLFLSIWEGPVPPEPPYPADRAIPEIPAVLVAGQAIELRSRLRIDLTPAEWTRLTEGIKTVLIFGKIEYRDAFGKLHKTGFGATSNRLTLLDCCGFILKRPATTMPTKTRSMPVTAHSDTNLLVR